MLPKSNHSTLIENLLNYDEIGRVLIISMAVLTAFLVVFYIVYRCFKPLIASNNRYIRELLDTLKVMRDKD